MKPILSLIATLLLGGCASQVHKQERILAMLSKGVDDTSVTIGVSRSLDLGRTLEFLWHVAWEDRRRPIDERAAADLALSKIARSYLFSEASFDLSKEEYTARLSDFFTSKYMEAGRKETRKAAALYQRQIREPSSEMLADQLGMPSLDALGLHLRPDQI